MAKKKRQHYKTGPKKGQFKGGAKKRRAKGKTVAKKRRYRRSYPKRRRRRSGSGGGKAPSLTSLKYKAEVAAGGAAYGYITEHTDLIAKLPYISTLSTGMKRDAVSALVLHYGGKKFKNKWADRMSVATFAIAGNKFGQAKFTISGGADVGFDDEHVLRGEEVEGHVEG